MAKKLSKINWKNKVRAAKYRISLNILNYQTAKEKWRNKREWEQ
jgi:hypothetical protein